MKESPLLDRILRELRSQIWDTIKVGEFIENNKFVILLN